MPLTLYKAGALVGAADKEAVMDLTTMHRACASTERVVANVTPEQYGRLTPCAAWTVHDVLNHLMGTLELGRALLGDTAPAVAVGPGEVPPVDMVGDDPAKAYRLGVEALLAAADGDALSRSHPTPLGDMPGPVLGGFTTLDILVHGWDLAAATGQPRALDDDLAEEVLAFARQAVTDDSRGERIGPAVPVADDAPPTDRLVAYLGRTP
ncbi:MAG TPA: TIGR03086 family metal-binding protein [Acidimicrobiales bacterium]